MINFIAHRFALVFVLLVSGFLLWGAEPALADGDPSKKVTIVSGFETAASNRTRTIVRKRRRGDRLVIDRRFVPLGGNNELSGGPNAATGRAATGRSRETVQNGVRVINGRGSSGNMIRIVSTR